MYGYVCMYIYVGVYVATGVCSEVTYHDVYIVIYIPFKVLMQTQKQCFVYNI